LFFQTDCFDTHLRLFHLPSANRPWSQLTPTHLSEEDARLLPFFTNRGINIQKNHSRAEFALTLATHIGDSVQFCPGISSAKPVAQTKPNHWRKPKMTKMIKKTLLVAFAGTMLVTASGCNDKDVATGVIVGGIIGGIIGGGGGGGVSVGTPTYGYAYLSDCEGWHREWICEWSYSSHSWYRSQRRFYHQFTESLMAKSDLNADRDLKAESISQRWALNPNASSKLSQAIESAKGGDLKAFEKVGLDIPVLARLLAKNQIDANDLAKFSGALDTNDNTALNILTAFSDEYSAQKKDVTGALWNQCQSTGHWKTPESASCSSLDQKGCAPATGASNCLSL
jgi:hypothetical protein